MWNHSRYYFQLLCALYSRLLPTQIKITTFKKSQLSQPPYSMHIQNICHVSSMPNIPEINTAMIPRGELLFATVYKHEGQSNGMESCQRGPKSEACGRSTNTGTFPYTKHQMGPQGLANIKLLKSGTPGTEIHILWLPAQGLRNASPNSETMTQHHHGYLFFYTATLFLEQLYHISFFFSYCVYLDPLSILLVEPG